MAVSTTIDKSAAIEEVRKWIDFILKRKGWNGTELARASGIAPSTVLRMFSAENYTFLTSLTTISAIASASGFKPPQSLMEAYGVANVGFESEVAAPRAMPARAASAASSTADLARLPLGRAARRVDAPAAEPPKKMLPVRNISSLPRQFVMSSDGEMSWPCPDRFLEDPTAFAFRLRETALEPAYPHGAMMFATKARNVMKGDMLLITKSGGQSVVRILVDQNEKGLVVCKGLNPDVTETIAMDKIDEVSIVVMMERA